MLNCVVLCYVLGSWIIEVGTYSWEVEEGLSWVSIGAF